MGIANHACAVPGTVMQRRQTCYTDLVVVHSGKYEWASPTACQGASSKVVEETLSLNCCSISTSQDSSWMRSVQQSPSCPYKALRPHVHAHARRPAQDQSRDNPRHVHVCHFHVLETDKRLEVLTMQTEPRPGRAPPTPANATVNENYRERYACYLASTFNISLEAARVEADYELNRWNAQTRPVAR
jgi:hypothetical protein